MEDVIVEADGQWHTSDNKFASTTWKATHPFKQETLSLPPTPVKRRSPTPSKAVTNGHPKPGSNNAEIVILDSDDEDEGQVKRELSPTAYRSMTSSLASFASNPPRSQTVDSDVIDLTLDSDDEEPLATQLAASIKHSLSQSQSQTLSKKRKSDERDIISPTEPIWKKSRPDAPLPPIPATGRSTESPAAYVNGTNGTNGASFSSPRDPARTLPPPSPNRYTSSYVARPPAPYNGSYIPPGSAPIPSRPPLPSLPPSTYSGSYARPNGAGTSSTSSWRS